MATTRQKDQASTPEERQAALQAYERFLEEAMREPMKYIKHDCRAHDDEALYRLVNRHGMQWYGWYWLLAELLASRKDHSYDVSDDAGWRRLTIDLSCMYDMSMDECKLFVAELDSVGLINHGQLSELHKVVITRIRMDANSYAEDVASKKLGAWKTNRRKLAG